MTPPNHTRLVVCCITIMGMSAAAGGCWLLWKGFAGGGELVVTLNTAISGLVGFLGGRMTPSGTTLAPTPDASASTTTVTQTTEPAEPKP